MVKVNGVEISAAEEEANRQAYAHLTDAHDPVIKQAIEAKAWENIIDPTKSNTVINAGTLASDLNLTEAIKEDMGKHPSPPLSPAALAELRRNTRLGH